MAHEGSAKARAQEDSCMKRRELEMALRAAAKLTRETEFLIIGSQAVHRLDA